MPFYLVTQTSLIEAKDGQSAARSVLETISRSEKVAFTVKLDDQHISHLIVSRQTDEQTTPDAAKIVEPVIAKASYPGSPVDLPQVAGRHRWPISVRMIVLLLASASVGLVSGLMLA